MKIYNTLTKTIEDFVPHDEELVTIYTCGPTVYNYAHIGNLRTYIFEDILEKGLEFLGYNVKRAMNITDVGHLTDDLDDGDDKMLLSAQREKKTVWEIADYYTDKFFEDFDKLNIRKPEIVDRATDNIALYIEMIEKFIELDIAYVAGGNVYFDISKEKEYYTLSGFDPSTLQVGVRESVEVDINKRNNADFGLWFTDSKFEDQAMKWDSPWGIGYPGWHIECSAIAIKNLGPHLDIHCGGVDLVFPHHSNEIAQSNAYLCAHGHDHNWCNYWVHGEHLIVENGKMSKSSGDFLTIDNLTKKGYDPLSFRYMCLMSHYRSQLSFSMEKLDESEYAYKKLLNRVQALDRTPNLKEDKLDYYLNEFKEAISDDLNFAMMITIIYDVLKDKEVNDFSKLYLIEKMDQVLGLDLTKEKEEIIVDDEVLLLIKKREEAKANKDYQLADKIRDDLLKQGIRLIDTKEETKYERI